MSEPSPPPPSRASAVKIVLSVVAIGGALALFLSASISGGGQYYKFVDEVMANTESFRGKKLKVHGVVADGSIEQIKGTLQYRFKIQSRPDRPPASVMATYEGLVPDTFKSGAEVIVQGSLTPDNHVAIIPDGIMAKCPSKYDPAEQDKKDREKQSGNNVAQQLKL